MKSRSRRNESQMNIPSHWIVRTSISRYFTVTNRTLARIWTTAFEPDVYDGGAETIRDVWSVTVPDSPDSFIEKPSLISAVQSMQDDWDVFEAAVVAHPQELARAITTAERLGRVITDHPLWQWRHPTWQNVDFSPYFNQTVASGQLTFFALRSPRLDEPYDYTPGVWEFTVSLGDVAVTSSRLMEPM